MFASLKRELSDEVGIECRSAKMLDAYHNYSISKRDHVIIYLVKDWQEKPVHERPKLEIAEIAWFKLDELPRELTPCTLFGIELCQQGIQ